MAVGLLLYLVIGGVRRRVTDPVIDTSLSLVTPFVAYVAAEEIHGSGVLAVVVAGLLLGHKAPILQTATSRIAERLNWRTISFLLENTVFLLIGLQARWILAGRRGRAAYPPRTSSSCAPRRSSPWSCCGWCGCSRPGCCWCDPGPTRRPGSGPSWRHTTVLGWAGMRGVVTLAAAFAIPESFEYRETLILTALWWRRARCSSRGRRCRGWSAGSGCPRPIRGRTPWPGPPCSRRPPRPVLERLDAHTGDDDPFGTVEALRQRVGAAQHRRLGAARRHPP